MSSSRQVAGTVLLLVAACSPSAVAQNYFSGLGFLDGDTHVSLAYGISPDGTTITGESRVFGHWSAFKWTASQGMIGLGLGQFNGDTVGFSVSNGGTRIAGIRDGASYWEAGTWHGLSFGANSSAQGVSDDGAYIVGGKNGMAYRWSQGGSINLGLLEPNHASGAASVSADGNVVVGAGTTNGGERAFRWTPNTGMVNIGSIDGNSNSSGAVDVAADGGVAVGWSNDSIGQQAVLWNANNDITPLGVLDPAHHQSRALSVSGDGSVIVGSSLTDGGDRAFLWTSQSGMVNLHDLLANQYQLDVAGWTLDAATSISNDGLTITGTGWNPQGLHEAWVAHVPGPATAPLIVMNLLAQRARRRRS